VVLDTFFTPSIVEDDDYKFSKSGIYYSPPVGSYEAVLDYVKGLPTVDEPELFGMHENANITFQLQDTNNLINTILAIQPRVASGGGGKSSEEIVDEVVADMLSSTPANLLADDACPTIFVKDEKGVMNSMDTVLLHEMGKFNRLLNVMRKMFSDMRKSIKGLVVMSAELEALFTAVMNNQIPEAFSKAGYPSLKPLSSWFSDLQLRVEFMTNWLKKGTPNCFWISGFFFPQGFMTGVSQFHARKYSLPIDTLGFGFKIMEHETMPDVPEPPEDGVYIWGLFLEAARWNREEQCLGESFVGELFSPVPCIHLIPVQHYRPPEGQYSCPLYKTNVRAGVLSTTGHSTNFILQMEIPTNVPPRNWVLKGTALVTMRND